MVWDFCTCLQWGAEVRRLQSGAGRDNFTHPLCWQCPELLQHSNILKHSISSQFWCRGGGKSTSLQANNLQRHEKGLYSIKLVWSFKLVCLVLSKGRQLPTEPALLSCAVTQQQHCPHPAGVCASKTSTLPARAESRNSPFIPAPGMLQPCVSWGSSSAEQWWTCCPTSDLLGSVGPHHIQSAVEVQSYLLLAWYHLRTLFGAVAPQPALHFNSGGCEELTSLLRLEEAPQVAFC